MGGTGSKKSKKNPVRLEQPHQAVSKKSPTRDITGLSQPQGAKILGSIEDFDLLVRFTTETEWNGRHVDYDYWKGEFLFSILFFPDSVFLLWWAVCDGSRWTKYSEGCGIKIPTRIKYFGPSFLHNVE